MNNTISTESFTQGFSFSYFGQTGPEPGASVQNTAELQRGEENNPSGARSRISPRQLQDEVLSGQRRELRSRGKQLLNFRFFTGGLDSGYQDSESPSLNALIVAASENKVNDMEFRLLNVTPTGQTREIYSSGDIEDMVDQLEPAGLDLRGLMLDREI